MQHQLTHLGHRIGRVGELVELFKEGFQFHALASSTRSHPRSLALDCRDSIS
jgi:hypothetical protein